VNGLFPNNFAKAVVASIRAGAEAVAQLPPSESLKMEDVVEFESSDEEELDDDGDLLDIEEDDEEEEEEEEMPTLINISDDSEDVNSASEGSESSDEDQDDDTDEDTDGVHETALDSDDQAMLNEMLSREFADKDGMSAPEEGVKTGGSSRKRKREADEEDTDEADPRRARR
jgi:hypothetical protein